MSTDLTTAHDHPAAVLDRWEEHSTEHQFKRLAPDEGVHMAFWDGVERSREVLRAHEEQHGVTFAALDDSALGDVRESWPLAVAGDAGAMADLVNSVRDLLGLED